jgi:DNA-binding LacI/PurR family transcriptional regulator
MMRVMMRRVERVRNGIGFLNIHDIARRLNISIGTISRALNDRAGVSAKTRERVLEAAKRYGYAPNQSGRSLRRGATGMIGFMVIPNRDRTTKGEAFFMTIFDGLQSVLAAHGLDLVIHYCGADQDPETHVQRIVERRMVDGLIISQINRSDPRIDYLIQKKLPFIAFGRSGTRRAHTWIDLDFEGVAEQSIDLLYRLGHRRIAIATAANDLNFGYLYLEACRTSLARRGITLTDDLILREPLTEAGGYSLGGRLLALRARPTAVVRRRRRSGPRPFHCRLRPEPERRFPAAVADPVPAVPDRARRMAGRPDHGADRGTGRRPGDPACAQDLAAADRAGRERTTAGPVTSCAQRKEDCGRPPGDWYDGRSGALPSNGI